MIEKYMQKIYNKIGENYQIKVGLLSSPTSGLDFIAYSSSEVILLSENLEIVWKRTFNDIKDVNIKQISDEYIGSFIEIDANEIIYLSYRGDQISPKYLDVVDKKYLEYVNRGFFSTSHVVKHFEGINLSSFEIEPGYYSLEVTIANNGEKFCLFDEVSTCLYYGDDSVVNLSICAFDKRFVRLGSYDEIEILNLEIKEIKEQKVVHFIGDSTLANHNRLPLFGYAQVFQSNSNVITNNLASCGRSIKSFIYEGRFNELLNNIKKDDVVFIGFGHNDEKSFFFGADTIEYVELLQYISRCIESKEAKAVICTPIARRDYRDGILFNTHYEYTNAILNKIDEYLIIDMTKITTDIINDLGEEKSVLLFNHHKYLKMVDNTHLSFEGANIICRKFINEIKHLDLI